MHHDIYAHPDFEEKMVLSIMAAGGRVDAVADAYADELEKIAYLGSAMEAIYQGARRIPGALRRGRAAAGDVAGRAATFGGKMLREAPTMARGFQGDASRAMGALAQGSRAAQDVIGRGAGVAGRGLGAAADVAGRGLGAAGRGLGAAAGTVGQAAKATADQVRMGTGMAVDQARAALKQRAAVRQAQASSPVVQKRLGSFVEGMGDAAPPTKTPATPGQRPIQRVGRERAMASAQARDKARAAANAEAAKPASQRAEERYLEMVHKKMTGGQDLPAFTPPTPADIKGGPVPGATGAPTPPAAGTPPATTPGASPAAGAKPPVDLSEELPPGYPGTGGAAKASNPVEDIKKGLDPNTGAAPQGGQVDPGKQTPAGGPAAGTEGAPGGKPGEMAGAGAGAEGPGLFEQGGGLGLYPQGAEGGMLGGQGMSQWFESLTPEERQNVMATMGVGLGLGGLGAGFLGSRLLGGGGQNVQVVSP